MRPTTSGQPPTGVCPFCLMAERLLRAKGVDVEKVRVDLEPERRQEMMARTGRRTAAPKKCVIR